MSLRPRAKYGNRKTTVDNIVFASKREAARYAELKMLLQAGEIRDLVLQPKFPLVVNGVKCGAYFSDFSYVLTATGEVITEDVKSPATRVNRVYRLKAKLVKALHGVTITEVG